jgi:hypothetical protein
MHLLGLPSPVNNLLVPMYLLGTSDYLSIGIFKSGYLYFRYVTV